MVEGAPSNDVGDAPSAAVALVQVDSEDVRLDRLLQLYMHEWSALVPTTIGDDARFEYRRLPAWRDRVGHAAYLCLAGARPIGFALAAVDEVGTWHVEEFFVIAGERRHGVGAACARALFATQPGPWSWTVRPENPAALAFWRRVAPGSIETVEVGGDAVARVRMRWRAPGSGQDGE